MRPLSRLFLAIVILMLAIGATVLWRRSNRPQDTRLTPRSPGSVERTLLASETFNLQTDPRWAAETVGGSGESLASVGCTLCCVSTALSHHGLSISPGELNRRLKEAGGYTERGWIKWGAFDQIAKGFARIAIPNSPTHRDIDDALRKGNPVLVKVLLSPGVNHWVLLVGRDGREYLMKDPLRSGRDIVPLSIIASDIYAVRIAEKTGR